MTTGGWGEGPDIEKLLMLPRGKATFVPGGIVGTGGAADRDIPGDGMTGGLTGGLTGGGTMAASGKTLETPGLPAVLWNSRSC